MRAEVNENGVIEINGIPIKEKIFEKSSYKLVDREQQIDNLITWIAECKTTDKSLMMADLK